MEPTTKCFNFFPLSPCISNHPFISKSTWWLQSCRMKIQIQPIYLSVLPLIPTNLQLIMFLFQKINSYKEIGYQLIKSTASCSTKKVKSTFKSKLYKKHASISQQLNPKQQQNSFTCLQIAQRWLLRIRTTSGSTNSTNRQRKSLLMRVENISVRFQLISTPKIRFSYSKEESTQDN